MDFSYLEKLKREQLEEQDPMFKKEVTCPQTGITLVFCGRKSDWPGYKNMSIEVRESPTPKEKER